MNNQRNYSLDAYRSLAALAVFWTHLAGFMLAPLDLNSHVTYFEKAVNASSGYGHQSVMIFFVLSGYLISRTIWENRSGWNLRSYLNKRLVRLWVVLVPCLFLTLIFNHLGSLNDPNRYYSGALSHLYKVERGWNVELGLDHFLGNLFFLQTIFCRFYGDNEVLWSLANEFWYYMLFPSIVFAFFARDWLRKSGCFIIALIILVFMPHSMRQGFLIWLVGFGVHLIHKSKLGGLFQGKWKSILALIAFLVVLQSTHSWIPSGFISDLLVATAFGFCMLACLAMDFLPAVLRKPAALMSDMSYTLYLAHFPVIAFYQTTILHNVQLPRSAQSLPHILFFGAAVIIYCFVIYFLFEKNTERIRKLFRLNSIGG